MEQKIYEIVNTEFKNFIEANETMFDSIKYDEVIKIESKMNGHTFYNTTAVLDPPFNVGYVVKKEGMEGDTITIINTDLEKLYVYDTAK